MGRSLLAKRVYLKAFLRLFPPHALRARGCSHQTATPVSKTSPAPRCISLRGLCASSLLSLTISGHVQAQGPAGAVIPPGGTPIPEMSPPSPPAVGPGTSVGPAARPSTDPALARQVTITTVEFVGATAFPPDRLAAVAGQLVGTVPLSRVDEARIAILNLYRDAGYVFTAVDATVERDGRLRLTVAEAEIVDVRLDGDIGPAGQQVLRFLENLRGVRPLDIATMERWLLLTQDIPGVSVRTVIRPAGTTPGALTMVAQLSRQVVSGFVNADNRAFRRTGPEQALATVALSALTGLGERTEFSLYYAAGYTSVFGQASTEFFTGSSGARVRIYAGTGASTPSAPLRDIGYQGTTTVAGLAGFYPVIRSRQQTLMVSLAFDVIESEIEVDNAMGGHRVLSRDSLRVARLGGEWAIFDQLLGDDRGAVNSIQLRLSQGLSGLGASDSGDPMLSRANAQTDFTKISFEVSRTQLLFAPWTGATLALMGIVAGQWSNDVLPQAEKFYLGGNRLGRGYYLGEVTGDSGIATTVELQLGMPYEAAVFGRSVRIDPTVYGFWDWGQTRENQPQDPDRWISSIGAGVRMNLTEHAEFQLEGVRRFQRRPNGAAGEQLKEDAVFWRVLFRL